MSQSNVLDQTRDQNLAVAANLTDLAATILTEVSGNEISNTIGGEPIGGQALRDMLAAKVGVALTKQSGG